MLSALFVFFFCTQEEKKYKIPRNYSILEVGKKTDTMLCYLISIAKKIIKGKRDDEEHLMTHQSIPYDDKKIQEAQNI